VKGDRHVVLNNTVVNCTRYPDPAKEQMNMGVMGYKALHGLDFNEQSVTRNNLANLAHRSWAMTAKGRVDAYKIPGIVDHNIRARGAAYRYLRDPRNRDFRPRAGSPLVDAGAGVAPEEVKSPVSRYRATGYVGKAPDIGAYEHGDKRYWIPGFQYPHASTPVPPDRATAVRPDADLMFLEAYRCTRHQVWFGEPPDRLRRIADLKDDTTNIVRPPALTSGKTYAWRVDALYADGRRVEGMVWTFTVKEGE
jgi:hypothetical protein